MTKAELEQHIKILENSYVATRTVISLMRKYVDSNLAYFRNRLADVDDPYNNGIVRVLVAIAEILNRYSGIEQIDLERVPGQALILKMDKAVDKSIAGHDAEKAVEVLKKMNGTLADAIIEITEPLDVLNFQDLEKIARCFENKIDQLIKEVKGEN